MISGCFYLYSRRVRQQFSSRDDDRNLYLQPAYHRRAIKATRGYVTTIVIVDLVLAAVLGKTRRTE